MNFGELKADVRSYLHRTDLDADIPGFIELARTRINRDMRVREQLVEKDVTPTTMPFPTESDFLEMRDIYHHRNGFRITLTLTSRRQLNDYRNTNILQSNPAFYSIDGLQLETAPGGTGVEFTELYYASVAELVNDADTNLLLDVYPSVWLYASLFEGHIFAQDMDLASAALDTYNSEIKIANDRAKQSESGASLQMQGATLWV